MKYVCGCMNVKLHVKGQALEPLDKREFGLTHIEYQNDPFFVKDVSQAQLDIEGIQQEYNCLVSHRTVGDWIVAQCINCEVSTHSVHVQQGGNRVLVNANLKGGSTEMERLKGSTAFSVLYKIVIQAHNDNLDIATSRRSYDTAQDGLNSIQQLLNSYLISEEAAMEERIRRFSESERAKYAHLQSRSRREKNTLIRLVMASNQGQLEDSLDMSDEQMTSPVTTSQESTDSSTQGHPITLSSSPDQSTNRTDNLILTSNQNFVLHQNESRLSVQSSHQPPQQQYSTSPETDEMFVLDGFEDSYPGADNSGSYESDDEESSDSGVSSAEVLPVRSIYSSSVPVACPSWPIQTKYTGSPGQDVPNDIAASIKALAQSVREDGTEIFGDLPRRASHNKFSGETVRK